MIGKLKRFGAIASWMSAQERNSTWLETMAASSYKHPKVMLGLMLARMNHTLKISTLHEAEFQVFSQFGDDGIIQWLIHILPIESKSFVEFGVEPYTESNTRFLVVKDKWRGLVMDGKKSHVDYIRRDLISILFDVKAEQAFITAENVNDLISSAGFQGRLGILSIDVDGMDYWIWKAISVVDPDIAIVEYNALFGPDLAVTVPYEPNFTRAAAHYSGIYYGASLAALRSLAETKGYRFIGCNRNGNNAYFVANRFVELPEIASLDARFQEATFAEYEENGRRIRGDERLSLLKGLPIYNVSTGGTETL